MMTFTDDERCFIWMWKRLGYGVKPTDFFDYSQKICNQLEAKGVMTISDEFIELDDKY